MLWAVLTHASRPSHCRGDMVVVVGAMFARLLVQVRRFLDARMSSINEFVESFNKIELLDEKSEHLNDYMDGMFVRHQPTSINTHQHHPLCTPG
jgi:hypothetical protein